MDDATGARLDETPARRPVPLAFARPELPCTQLLEACARITASARSALATDAGPADLDLLATLDEATLLCRATVDAIALQARTERELRLICAAICHLCAEQCSVRAEPWAEPLAALCSRCADACRDGTPALRRPRAAG